ncbi:hypothetical protein VTK26DRAFT_7946 [Humicola hyalothermophila]
MDYGFCLLGDLPDMATNALPGRSLLLEEFPSEESPSEESPPGLPPPGATFPALSFPAVPLPRPMLPEMRPRRRFPLRILVAPSSFGGCFTAKGVAGLVEQSIRDTWDEERAFIQQFPLSSGGKGLLAQLVQAQGGKLRLTRAIQDHHSDKPQTMAAV